jgi:hypothetical protein
LWTTKATLIPIGRVRVAEFVAVEFNKTIPSGGVKSVVLGVRNESTNEQAANDSAQTPLS